MILRGGRIYTGDPAVPHVAALAVTRDGRVARGVEAWEGDGSQVSSDRIELDGRTVLPGLADAHVHFRSWALEQRLVDLADCISARDCAERLAAATGAWVIGRGWRADQLDREPTATLLDELCGDRPVAAWANDRHTLVLSSRAIELTGAVTADGLLRERDAWAVPLPEPTPAEALAAVDRAQRAAHARGVTQIHDFEGSAGFAIWQQLAADRSQTLRVVAAQLAENIDALLATGLRTGFGDGLLRVGPVKAFMDGTLSSRTAWMLEPYADGGSGERLSTVAELTALVRAATAGGLAVAVHAIGDRAVREALDAFEATGEAWREAGLRPRIEHAQLVHPDDRARFATIGVIASMQPSHAPSDRPTAVTAWAERIANAYAWPALAAAGATLAFGSDAPIEALDPLAGIAAAVAGSLGRGAAVAGFTSGAALAAGWERRLGRLAPGFEADLVVLDDDPFTCPPDRIGEIDVVATMVGGRFVHGRPPW